MIRVTDTAQAQAPASCRRAMLEPAPCSLERPRGREAKGRACPIGCDEADRVPRAEHQTTRAGKRGPGGFAAGAHCLGTRLGLEVTGSLSQVLRFGDCVYDRRALLEF